MAARLAGAGRAAAVLGCCAVGLGLVTAGGCETGTPPGPGGPSWTVVMGGAGFQAATSVAATNDTIAVGAIYTGGFRAGDRVIAGAGGLDGVVVAMRDGGEVRWARELGGAGDDLVVGLATDPAGSVYVAGQATRDATFAGRPLVVDGESGALLAKLDADGNLSWAVVGRGGGFQSATAVVADGDGAVFVAGDFTGDLDLGQGMVSATDGGDAFVARVTAAGEVQWVKVITGAGIQHASELSVLADGGVAVIGYYEGTLAIDADLRAGNPVSNFTPFVARLAAADGTLAWSQTYIVPPGVNHIGHTDHEHPALVAIQDLSLDVAPSGDIMAAITYGNVFGHGEQDFEAPAVSHLVMTRLGGDGRVLEQRNLDSPKARVQLGKVLWAGEGAQLVASWWGQLGDGAADPALDSGAHRSLGLLDPGQGESSQLVAKLSIDGVGLASADAVRRPDGSTVVVVGWTDLVSLDDEVAVTSFP